MKNEVTTQVKRNLYQKLHLIQQTVIGLGKDKKAFNYSYTTGEKIISEIKPLMNSLGLLLVPNVVDTEMVRQDYTTPKGQKSENTFLLKMVFTWIDVESGEKLDVPFSAAGQNDWDKGLGGALTFGTRYFLLKFFHISTDQDDIDNLEVRRFLEESLSVAESYEELTTIWEKLDAQQKKRMQKKFTERNQYLKAIEKPKNTNVSEGL